jgi:hypothetical protein
MNSALNIILKNSIMLIVSIEYSVYLTKVLKNPPSTISGSNAYRVTLVCERKNLLETSNKLTTTKIIKPRFKKKLKLLLLVIPVITHYRMIAVRPVKNTSFIIGMYTLIEYKEYFFFKGRSPI